MCIRHRHEAAHLNLLPAKIALQSFKGIGSVMSLRICQHLQFHEGMLVQQMTETQVNALSAFLSDPQTALKSSKSAEAAQLKRKYDPLDSILLESDLRREIRQNIAHHRNIGTHRGRRHAMGYPVRGQRTHTNARTAKKLNRVERAI